MFDLPSQQDHDAHEADPVICFCVAGYQVVEDDPSSSTSGDQKAAGSSVVAAVVAAASYKADIMNLQVGLPHSVMIMSQLCLFLALLWPACMLCCGLLWQGTQHASLGSNSCYFVMCHTGVDVVCNCLGSTQLL